MINKILRLLCYIGLHKWLEGYSRAAIMWCDDKKGSFKVIVRGPIKVCRYCNKSKDLWRVKDEVRKPGSDTKTD